MTYNEISLIDGPFKLIKINPIFKFALREDLINEPQFLPTRAEPAVVDLLGNQDLVLNFNSLAVMGASDLRGWMWSNGSGS